MGDRSRAADVPSAPGGASPPAAVPRSCAAALAAGALVATVALAGCTTTQDRSAAMSKNAAKAAAEKVFRVGKTNRDVTVEDVVRLEGDGAAAVVVKLDNRTSKPQTLVPIGVDLYDAKRVSIYTNRIDGLDPALNNVPVAPPGVSYWVNNQVPTVKPARTRVRLGTSRAAAPSKLPAMKLAKVKLGEDSGVKTARGVVRNLSAVEQRKLTIFAVATKGDRVVAAGRGVVDRLAAKGGRAQHFNIYFTGDPSGAKLHLFAPPSTLGAA
jgi:hypothetical protein